VAEGAEVELRAVHFGEASLEATRRRGASEEPRFAVDGRNRLTLQSGLWGAHGTAVEVAGRGFDVYGGIQYARYLREDLAVTLGFNAFGAEAQVDVMGGLALPIGIEWNPRPGPKPVHAWKPFLGAGLVPVTTSDSWGVRSERRTTVGAHIGAGFDYQLTESFALGVAAGFNAIPELGPGDLHDNFHGLELTLRLGWLFGRGRGAEVPLGE
jgi:hypothetical protein